MRDKIACIYAIVNMANGRRYVGSTSDFKVRQSGHLSMLRRGVHENSYLQRSWTKHGETAFIFIVVERCEVSDLHVREQYHLDACQPHVYNRGIVASSPRRGMKWTDAERAKKVGTKASSTARANRKKAWDRWRAANTHCHNGHEWNKANTRYAYRKDGSLERRICLTCRRAMFRRKWQRDKIARGPIVRKPITLEARAALRAGWKKRGGGYWKGQKFSESHKAALRKAWILRKARKIQEVA